MSRPVRQTPAYGISPNAKGRLWVVLARLVAAYISDWCRTGTGQNTTFSTDKNGDQRLNEGRREEVKTVKPLSCVLLYRLTRAGRESGGVQVLTLNLVERYGTVSKSTTVGSNPETQIAVTPRVMLFWAVPVLLRQPIIQ